jgi:hypothetical protein
VLQDGDDCVRDRPELVSALPGGRPHSRLIVAPATSKKSAGPIRLRAFFVKTLLLYFQGLPMSNSGFAPWRGVNF